MIVLITAFNDVTWVVRTNLFYPQTPCRTCVFIGGIKEGGVATSLWSEIFTHKVHFSAILGATTRTNWWNKIIEVATSLWSENFTQKTHFRQFWGMHPGPDQLVEKISHERLHQILLFGHFGGCNPDQLVKKIRLLRLQHRFGRKILHKNSFSAILGDAPRPGPIGGKNKSWEAAPNPPFRKCIDPPMVFILKGPMHKF